MIEGRAPQHARIHKMGRAMARTAKAVLTLFILTALCLPSLSQAQAPTPQEALTQYVAALQRNPNDMALREKIIRYVQTMTPAPAIPDRAPRCRRTRW